MVSASLPYRSISGLGNDSVKSAVSDITSGITTRLHTPTFLKRTGPRKHQQGSAHHGSTAQSLTAHQSQTMRASVQGAAGVHAPAIPAPGTYDVGGIGAYFRKVFSTDWRQKFSPDLALDLGTANSLVFVRGKGIVLNEPSLVAVDTNTGKALAAGRAARQLFGRTHDGVEAVRPMKDGVISDFDYTALMIRTFLKKAMSGSSFWKPNLVVGVPSGITQVEKRAVIDAAIQAGVRQVKLVEEPMAAALGAGLPVNQAVGSMIVDIGGGTTEVAILCLGSTVYSRSIRVAGDELDEAIQRYLRRHFGLEIGIFEAERLKLKIGGALPFKELRLARTYGRDVRTSLPQQANVSDEVIRDAIAEPLSAIIDSVNTALEHSNPEIAHDIMTHGVYLAGGGALLHGLAERLQTETGIPFHRAPEPLSCVVRGVGEVMQNMQSLGRLCIA